MGSSMARAPGSTAMGTWVSRSASSGCPSSTPAKGVWSWVHIDDAAAATAAALECAPSAYNIVDSDPTPQRVWLPAFARAVGAPAPPRIADQEALAAFGPDTVYYATRLRGASNEKAKRELNFQPRPLEWVDQSQP
jgi:nucleoside-diphosphate-sugar epimerase